MIWCTIEAGITVTWSLPQLGLFSDRFSRLKRLQATRGSLASSSHSHFDQQTSWASHKSSFYVSPSFGCFACCLMWNKQSMLTPCPVVWEKSWGDQLFAGSRPWTDQSSALQDQATRGRDAGGGNCRGFEANLWRSWQNTVDWEKGSINVGRPNEFGIRTCELGDTDINIWQCEYAKTCCPRQPRNGIV